MTARDMPAFLAIFQGLARVFALRVAGNELDDIGAQYFKALRDYPIDRVKAAADNCLKSCERFPKPVDWMKRMPFTDPGAMVAELSAAEAAEWLRAERRRWEDDPCGCEACRAAGVEHRFVRWVPEFTTEDREMRGKIGTRIVTCGHWAHGEELRRWYAAKDACLASFRRLLRARTIDTPKKQAFKQRIEDIFAEKRRVPVEIVIDAARER